MGVPSFFREILEKYRQTHFWDQKFQIDLLFIDFNATIYTALHSYFKRITYDAFEKMTPLKRDNAIVQHVVQYTLDLINNLLRPRKLLYLAFDGSAPRSKMQLQRERRYHKLKKDAFVEGLREIYKVKTPDALWDSSAISPGTRFMTKLSEALWKAIEKKQFMEGKITVILSDTNRPGEGEHKIMPFLRSLKKTSDSIVIYSQDADLIILSMALPQENIYILRDKDKYSKMEMELYPDTNHLYLSMSKYVQALKENYKLTKRDPVRVAYDLLFLSFFGGNDFIRPIMFLRINKNGWSILSSIYRNVSEKLKDTPRPYLVEFREGTKHPIVNTQMLSLLLQEFANMEDRKMKEQYERMLASMERKNPTQPETFEEKVSAFEHTYYYSPDNMFPQFEEFKKINYALPRNQWKDQYYSYFFGLSPENQQEYRQMKKTICMVWLQSLVYTLRYYLEEVPSWRWYYPFRVSPLPSDLLFFLRDAPENLDFVFSQEKPYTPFEQLAYILPPHDNELLPKPIRSVIQNPSSVLAPFYPIDFQLDVVVGEKFIYAKPLLPAILDEMALPVLESAISKLTEAEKERNKILMEPLVYNKELNPEITDLR